MRAGIKVYITNSIMNTKGELIGVVNDRREAVLLLRTVIDNRKYVREPYWRSILDEKRNEHIDFGSWSEFGYFEF